MSRWVAMRVMTSRNERTGRGRPGGAGYTNPRYVYAIVVRCWVMGGGLIDGSAMR